MQLTRESVYAIQGLAFLAQQPSGGAVALADVAATQNLPRSFLAKIFQKLARHGVLAAGRGPASGYVLTPITRLDHYARDLGGGGGTARAAALSAMDRSLRRRESVPPAFPPRKVSPGARVAVGRDHFGRAQAHRATGVWAVILTNPFPRNRVFQCEHSTSRF